MSNTNVPEVFRQHITRIEDLQALDPEPPLNITYEKVLSKLDAHYRSLFAAPPYVVMSTSEETGRCHAFP